MFAFDKGVCVIETRRGQACGNTEGALVVETERGHACGDAARLGQRRAWVRYNSEEHHRADVWAREGRVRVTGAPRGLASAGIGPPDWESKEGVLG